MVANDFKVHRALSVRIRAPAMQPMNFYVLDLSMIECDNRRVRRDYVSNETATEN